MNDLRAIFFDVDGTLVDSNDLHVDAWEKVFREAGFSLDRKAIHDQIGKGGDNLVPALLPGIGEYDCERIAKRHGELFKGQYIDRVRPFMGARELLARVHSDGLKVVLASSASREELDHYVDLLDAWQLVDTGTSKDDVERSKPDPDVFAAALEKAAVAAGEVLVVGDTPYDVSAAARCGIAAIGVLTGGFPEAVLRDTGAIAIYRDIADLLAGYDYSPLARAPLPHGLIRC